MQSIPLEGIQVRTISFPLGYVPAYVKSDASMQQSHDYIWHFDTLESHTTSPTLAYVTEAMRHGDVPATLKGWLFKTRVYIVTGPFGAEAQTSDLDQAVTVGMKAKVGEKRLDSEDFDKSSDFVFAYRLNEIRYRGTIKHNPYNGSETSSADAPQRQAAMEIELDDFKVLKIVDTPVGKDAKNFEALTVPGFEDLECYVANDD
ncbi:hypothetical protein ACQKWADRAFT_330826 [Trichoderma austrokoningii]